MNKILNSLLALFLLSSLSDAVVASDAKVPSKYAVHQQQGPVCPHLPWVNLLKLRAIRERGQGHVIFQEEDYHTKVNSYALFLPCIRALDRAYDVLRERNGPYAEYERAIRTDGIKASGRFDRRGNFVDKIDWNPLNQARRDSCTPFNIETVDNSYDKMKRWLPILQNPLNDRLYFYDYTTGKTTLLEKVAGHADPNIQDARNVGLGEGNVKLWVVINAQLADQTIHFEPWMLEKMGLSTAEIMACCTAALGPFAGFPHGYFMLASSNIDLNKDYFYDVGTYQHMLFACGLKADNTLFAENEDTFEARAYREYHQAMIEDPRNPWSQINKEDLFEYHLAQLFKTNLVLKQKAIATVGFYNDCWRFYKESFDLYDAPKEPRVKLSEKQRFMPGEDQMLAYLFSSQLRFVWAASISMEALIDVEELEDNIGETMLKALKAGSSIPGIPGAKNIVSCADKKDYGPRGAKYSFLDAWADIKAVLKHDVIDVLNRKDFVSFSSHGSVISFDDELVAMQSHEFRPTAEKLGFEMLDSTYDKGLNPFYRKPGSQADVIEF